MNKSVSDSRKGLRAEKKQFGELSQAARMREIAKIRRPGQVIHCGEDEVRRQVREQHHEDKPFPWHRNERVVHIDSTQFVAIEPFDIDGPILIQETGRAAKITPETETRCCAVILRSIRH